MNKDARSVSHPSDGLSSMANPLNNDAWGNLVDSTEIFLKSLQLGRVRGVVTIVGTPNAENENKLRPTELINELINRDILVTMLNAEPEDDGKMETEEPDFSLEKGDGLAEFCNFIGIQPVLHIGDSANAADILDFYADVAQQAAVEIAGLPVAVLAANGCKGTEGLGTDFTMGDDPVKTADLIDHHIHDKRIGAQWCDRCGGRFSPFS